MNDLKFNIYGLAAPKTRAEYIGLLDEALRLAKELNQLLDQNTKLMEDHAATHA